MAYNDYGFELLSNEFLDIQDILDNNLWDDSHLFQDLNDSINTSEMARRKFRDIAAGIDEEDPFAAAAGDVRDLQQGFRQLNLGERFQGFATGGKVNSQPLMKGIDEAIPAPKARGPLIVLIKPNSTVNQKKRSN